MPPKIATRSSLEQVAIIDRLLQRQHGATLDEMAVEMDSSTKTVRRHLHWIHTHFEVRIAKHGFGLGARYVYPNGQASIFTREATRRIESWGR